MRSLLLFGLRWGSEELRLERPGAHEFGDHLIGHTLSPLLDARDEGGQQIDQLLLQVSREQLAASVVLKRMYKMSNMNIMELGSTSKIKF